MVQELVKRNKKQDKQMADLTSMFQQVMKRVPVKA
jgi:hypothetical protein